MYGGGSATVRAGAIQDPLTLLWSLTFERTSRVSTLRLLRPSPLSTPKSLNPWPPCGKLSVDIQLRLPIEARGELLTNLCVKMQEKARNHFRLPFKKKKPLRISQAFLPTSVESCQHSHSTFKCQNLSNGLLQIFSPRLK